MGGVDAPEDAEIVFGVLGPLEVAGVGARRLGGAQQRALLADLVYHAGQVVSTDRLIVDLWDGIPPASADHTVEAYISRLRRLFAECGVPATITTRAPGYRLDVDAEQVDVGRFRRLIIDAANVGDAPRARELRISADDLWRGEAFADLRGIPFVAPIARALDDDRLTNIERRVELDLESGRHHDTVGELQALVREHPDRESFTGQLMVALYRCGRQVDALAAYQRTRERLVGEWGVDPGPELRDLEQAVLRHDSALLGAAASPRVSQQKPDAGPSAGTGRPATSPRRRPPTRVIALAGVLVAAAAAAVVISAHHDTPAAPAQVPASGVGIIDTAGRVRGGLGLPDAPGQAVAGAGSVWVTSPEGHQVYRIDPGTGRVVQTIPAGSGAGDMAVADGTVWVANTLDGTVTRISANANTSVQTIAVGSQPAGIAATEQTVFVALPSARQIVLIDADSGRIERTIGTDLPPSGIAVTGRTLWFSSPAAGIAENIDIATGAAQLRLPVGAAPEAIVAAFDAVWVANSSDSTVTRIDPRRAAVVATIPVGDGPTALSVAADGLWVANRAAGTAVHLDSTQDRVTKTVRVGNRPQGLAVTDRATWVTVRPGPRAVHRGGTVRTLSQQPVPSIDPALTWPDDPPQLFAGTYDTLVTYRRTGTADGLDLVPDLALAIPAPTDDGRTYTFVLRAGLRYDTGAPLRPADFRHGLERLFTLNPGASSYYAALLDSSRCAAGAPCDLSRAVITDDNAQTVTLRLSRPDPDLLYKLTLASAAPVPPSIPARDVGTAPIPSTGPYRIARFTPTQEIVLDRNPNFREWSSAAQPDGFPDQIVWSFGHPVRDEIDAVESGRADWVSDALPDPTALMVQFPTRTHTNPLLGIAYIAFSVNAPPFNDVRVRQAVSLAADRTEIVAVLGGSAQAAPTCQIIPPGLTGYVPFCPFTAAATPAGTWRGPDLPRARRLVAASGTRGMHVTLNQHRGDAVLGTAEARILTSLGYRVTIRTIPDEQWNSIANDSRHHPQTSVGQWILDYPSPSNFFSLFFACDAYTLGDPTRTRSGSFFCDPALDRQMTDASQAELTDPATATALWLHLDRTITSTAVWVPLVSLKTTDFLSTRTGNYTYHPAIGLLLDQLWVH